MWRSLRNRRVTRTPLGSSTVKNRVLAVSRTATSLPFSTGMWSPSRTAMMWIRTGFTGPSPSVPGVPARPRRLPRRRSGIPTAPGAGRPSGSGCSSFRATSLAVSFGRAADPTTRAGGGWTVARSAILGVAHDPVVTAGVDIPLGGADRHVVLVHNLGHDLLVPQGAGGGETMSAVRRPHGGPDDLVVHVSSPLSSRGTRSRPRPHPQIRGRGRCG